MNDQREKILSQLVLIHVHQEEKAAIK